MGTLFGGRVQSNLSKVRKGFYTLGIGTVVLENTWVLGASGNGSERLPDLPVTYRVWVPR